MKDILARLDKLERSNRRLRGTLTFALVSLLGLAALGATSSTPKVIEAERFVLLDAAGAERAVLFSSDKTAGLIFLNKNKTRAASVMVGSETNGVMLWDRNGNLRQVLSSDLDESAWNIFEPGSDKPQISFTDNQQGAALVVRDKTNHDRVSLGFSAQGSALMLGDEEGVTRSAVTADGLGFTTFSADGSLEWSPTLAQMTPDQQKRLKGILPKLPK